MDHDDPAGAVHTGLRRLIRSIPDFPRPGIEFRDITPLLRDAGAFRLAVDALVAPHRRSPPDLVAGIEARGFILGGAIAHQLGAGFLPLRKHGRLPAATVSAAYALEYAESTLEMHRDAVAEGQRVLVVDDVLATGGTAAAAIQLIEQLGGVVAGLSFLLELRSLGGAAALGGRHHEALLSL